MSGQQDKSAPASPSVTHEEVTVLDVDAVDISYDDRFLYAACQDKYVRVWSKGDWQLVVRHLRTTRVYVAKGNLGDDWLVRAQLSCADFCPSW
jgi:hypothetical protein